MAKAKQVYSEGKQVNITDENDQIVDVYMVRGSVTEVRQKHGNRQYLRHIITVTWAEDDNFGNEYGTWFDEIRPSTWSNSAEAIRECIKQFDECAYMMKQRISVEALARLPFAAHVTDDGEPAF